MAQFTLEQFQKLSREDLELYKFVLDMDGKVAVRYLAGITSRGYPVETWDDLPATGTIPGHAIVVYNDPILGSTIAIWNRTVWIEVGGQSSCQEVKDCIEDFTDLDLSNLESLILGGDITFAEDTSIDRTNTTNTGIQDFDENYTANYVGSHINYSEDAYVNLNHSTLNLENGSELNITDSTVNSENNTYNNNGDTVNNSNGIENNVNQTINNDVDTIINNNGSTINNTDVTENRAGDNIINLAEGASITNNLDGTVNNNLGDTYIENNTYEDGATINNTGEVDNNYNNYTENNTYDANSIINNEGGTINNTNQTINNVGVTETYDETSNITYEGTINITNFNILGTLKLKATPTTGTSTAYEITQEGMLAYADNDTFLIKFHTTNGATPTLNVQSLGAKAIKDQNGDDLSLSILNPNITYTVTYDLTDDVFYLLINEATSYVSDEAYGPTWNGITDIAPSKNAVYDKLESIQSQIGLTGYGSLVQRLTSDFDIELTDEYKLKLTSNTANSIIPGKTYYNGFFIEHYTGYIYVKTYDIETNAFTTISTFNTGWGAPVYFTVTTSGLIVAIISNGSSDFIIRTYQFDGVDTVTFVSQTTGPIAGREVSEMRGVRPINDTTIYMVAGTGSNCYVLERDNGTELWSVSLASDILNTSFQAVELIDTDTLAVSVFEDGMSGSHILKRDGIAGTLTELASLSTNSYKIVYPNKIDTNKYIGIDYVLGNIRIFEFNGVDTLSLIYTQTEPMPVSSDSHINLLGGNNFSIGRLTDNRLHIMGELTVTDNNGTGVLGDLQVSDVGYKFIVEQSGNKICYADTKIDADNITMYGNITPATGLHTTIHHFLVNGEQFEVIGDNLFLR